MGTVEQIDATLSEVNDRTKAQVARVDGMISETLTTTNDIAGSIQRGIKMPIREVAGIFAGVKAAVDVLAGRESATPDGAAAAAKRAASATASATPVTPISPRPYTAAGGTGSRARDL